MVTKPVRQKVLCYVVRDGRLLVFRHLDQPWEESGLQVPAGTIEPGENPSAAALREATEETGLTGLYLSGKVGETEYDLSPYRDEVHHRHVYRLGVDSAPARWVSHEHHPAHGGPSIRFECFWIPLAQGHSLSGGQGALLGALASMPAVG